ncbi:hypothetical protein DY000_02064410, partial [Brassica cretica]
GTGYLLALRHQTRFSDSYSDRVYFLHLQWWLWDVKVEKETRVVDPMTGRYVDAERKPPVMDNELKEDENAEDKCP